MPRYRQGHLCGWNQIHEPECLGRLDTFYRPSGLSPRNVNTQSDNVVVAYPFRTIVLYTRRKLLLWAKAGKGIMPWKVVRAASFQFHFICSGEFPQLAHQADKFLKKFVFVAGRLHPIRSQSALAKSMPVSR